MTAMEKEVPPRARRSLSDEAAGKLSDSTKTVAQMPTITPRWLTHLLQWVPVEGNVYRVNQVYDPAAVSVATPLRDESDLPGTFVGYDTEPREYYLNTVSTIVDIHTRISDLYSSEHDQVKEQLRLAVETIRERQEHELINSADYGLLGHVTDSQRISTRIGPPTPDDLDDLIRKVWKQPAFFLTHPDGIAAFGRECTRRGVPPSTVSLFGSQFITWRGLPLIPSNKVPVEDGRTKFLLMRVGEERQGVVGLYNAGPHGDHGSMGLTVRFTGIERNGIASYLIALYYSLGVLVHDALAVLDGAEVDRYHDYGHKYHE
jgi:Phage capsid-like protein